MSFEANNWHDCFAWQLFRFDFVKMINCFNLFSVSEGENLVSFCCFSFDLSASSIYWLK